MRLLLLARDYAQSFPNYKRSEDQTLGIEWGKPSVLISYCGEYTLISMSLCVELSNSFK